MQVHMSAALQSASIATLPGNTVGVGWEVFLAIDHNVDLLGIVFGFHNVALESAVLTGHTVRSLSCALWYERNNCFSRSISSI